VSDHIGLHFDRAALLVVDMQFDFIDGAMTVPGTAWVVPAVAEVAGAFRRAGQPVVHVIRYYPPGGSDVDSVRRSVIESGARIAAPGTPGSLIPGELTGGGVVDLDHVGLLRGEMQDLGAGQVVLYKPRWSAFHRTRLHQWLTAAGVDSVVVAGCNLANCPRATLFDASAYDYRTGIVVDAVSGTTGERLDDLTLIGVNLLTTGQVVAALG
jgi:nicotinamidase-related amidase